VLDPIDGTGGALKGAVIPVTGTSHRSYSHGVVLSFGDEVETELFQLGPLDFQDLHMQLDTDDTAHLQLIVNCGVHLFGDGQDLRKSIGVR
jgi:hypothetical protein